MATRETRGYATDLLMENCDWTHRGVNNEFAHIVSNTVSSLNEEYKRLVEEDTDNRIDQIRSALISGDLINLANSCCYCDGEHFSVTAVEVSDSVGNTFTFASSILETLRNDQLLHHNEKDVRSMSLKELRTEKKKLADQKKVLLQERRMFKKEKDSLPRDGSTWDYENYTKEQYDIYEKITEKIQASEKKERGIKRRKREIENRIRWFKKQSHCRRA